jgi:transcription initiation factor TFIIH subunit 2
MAGRRDDEYMDVDSDSGGSFVVDDREDKATGRGAKGKGKKASRRKGKGKGKATEVGVARKIIYAAVIKQPYVASILLGSILYPLMGCRARGRGRKLAACR